MALPVLRLKHRSHRGRRRRLVRSRHIELTAEESPQVNMHHPALAGSRKGGTDAVVGTLAHRPHHGFA